MSKPIELPIWSEAMEMSAEDFEALLSELEIENEAEELERDRLNYLSEGQAF